MPSRGSAKCLIAEKSVFTKPGPETGVRIAVPSSPAAGALKQEVLNHSLSIGLPAFGLQVWSGRLRLFPLFSKFTPEPLLLSTTKTGNPEVAFSIRVTSQPPRAVLTGPRHELPNFFPLPNGSW